ncbi:hypothetical protein HO609_02280 [Streptococcus suis]|uniref:hypothetical protein n=1 Tax=Streptococcus suis TaxID=1307 RepID=UPI0005CCB9D0|nr:hypothetical protein [Streptococcus suis]NQI41948.1 hypothetical protein [Streptococcus suis]CYU12371.1 Uncharacterised protein [Streptococcus suis]
MASLTIDLSVDWENQDEFQRLLQNFDEAQQAYQNALKELSEFKPDIRVVSGVKKGDYKTHEQAYQEEMVTD